VRNPGQDLRFALRMMWRRRAVSLLAVLVLGLGIGASTTVFALINAVLLRPLPYPSPDRLLTIWETRPEWRLNPVLARQWNRVAFTWQDVRAVRADASTLAQVELVHEVGNAQLTGADNAVEVDVAHASAGLLSLLGVRPAAGRWFAPTEEGPGAPAVAVISDAVWSSRFGRDTGALNHAIELDGRRYILIGVLPATFRFGSVGPFATPGVYPEIWLPIGISGSDTTVHSYNHEVIARMRPGAQPEDVRRQVDAILRDGRNPDRFGVQVMARADAETGQARRSLWLLFGASALLLLIACANAALLLLGESTWRIHEMAIRRALGASPGTLARQLLVEHLLLGLGAGAIGVAASIGLVRLIPAVVPVPLPRLQALHVDLTALAFAVGVAMVGAVTAGVAPLVTLARYPDDALRARTATPRAVRRQRRVLIAQTALAMLLLAASGMLTMTLWREAAVEPGFAPTHRLVVRVDLADFRYPSDTARRQFDFLVADRLKTIPGVSAVTATSSVPLGDRGRAWAVNPDISARLAAGVGNSEAQHDEVMPGWFAVMGIPLRAGRGFEATDGPGTPPVAVVNETMARTLWPGTVPVGRQFIAPNGGVRTVIGVAADLHHRGLADPPEPTFYQSLWQQPPSTLSFVVVSSTPVPQLVASVRRIMHDVDPQLPIERIDALDRIVSASLVSQRFRAGLIASFAVLATLLVGIGIGGVAAGAVRRSMRELCVRLAVGGSPSRVRMTVLIEQLRAVTVGLLVGAVGAVLLARLVTAYLYGAALVSTVSTVGAAALLVAIACLAATIPTRGLARVELARWLRGDATD
jgi:putative ABC transport system permease protein